MLNERNPAVIKMLENQGWVLECLGPLELSHPELECFASRYAAQIVIEDLIRTTASAVLEKKVEDWHHQYPENVSLHKFIGLSIGEYQDWMKSSFLKESRMEQLIKEYNAAPKDFVDFLG